MLFYAASLGAQDAFQPKSDFQLTAPNDPIPFAETITKEDMKAILTVLASDEFEGRETGQEGNKKAANFIAEKIKKFWHSPSVKNQFLFSKNCFYGGILERAKTKSWRQRISKLMGILFFPQPE